eukprot:GHVH01008622.1.p1 GENE.GHVH01008622.1~~GHVH01008622.1.p1  ORF type:complete len:131 (-),score=21.33 GHVH01008622.1:32-424(-)
MPSRIREMPKPLVSVMLSKKSRRCCALSLRHLGPQLIQLNYEWYSREPKLVVLHRSDPSAPPVVNDFGRAGALVVSIEGFTIPMAEQSREPRWKVFDDKKGGGQPFDFQFEKFRVDLATHSQQNFPEVFL